MDANFYLAIDTILDHEGRGPAVNNSNDPGGLTKFGISQRAYPNLDIRNLTEDQAKDIYYKDYWTRGRYAQLEDLRIATKIFDCGVNMGIKAAAKLAQRAAHASGIELKVDGILGRRSFAAINSLSSELFVAAMKAEQYAYYRIIMAKNPKLRAFKNGWKKRAYS